MRLRDKPMDCVRPFVALIESIALKLDRMSGRLGKIAFLVRRCALSRHRHPDLVATGRVPKPRRSAADVKLAHESIGSIDRSRRSLGSSALCLSQPRKRYEMDRSFRTFSFDLIFLG